LYPGSHPQDPYLLRGDSSPTNVSSSPERVTAGASTSTGADNCGVLLLHPHDRYEDMGTGRVSSGDRLQDHLYNGGIRNGDGHSDILRVFQWGLTKSVCSLIQRFGRAARDPKLTATCTLVISREYFNITFEDDFQNTNDTQRKMEQNKPDLYKILRAKCLRQGFLNYLGVSSQYVEPAPGKCCSRCSERASLDLDDVFIGTKGLSGCDPAKEAIRQEGVAVRKSPTTDNRTSTGRIADMATAGDKGDVGW
jgi:hypothetical protein